jgi:ER membrane protein complex subunit 4
LNIFASPTSFFLFSHSLIFSPLLTSYGFSVDLNLKENHEGFHTLSKCPLAIGHELVKKAERKSLNQSTAPSNNTAALVAKRKQKAMAMAMNPAQQIAMNAFMMYMSGSSLNMFSITTTSTAILTPIASIFSVERTFGNLDVDTQMAKAVYIGINLVWLTIGLYKMSSMRLLPTTSADFADSLAWKEMMETSSIPPVMM